MLYKLSLVVLYVDSALRLAIVARVGYVTLHDVAPFKEAVVVQYQLLSVPIQYTGIVRIHKFDRLGTSCAERSNMLKVFVLYQGEAVQLQ
eukprot:1172798-Rhodomonas_salina.6